MFGSFPTEVVEFIRETFASANQKVSSALTLQPSMHEETLDHMLIAELSACPPTFFANCNAAVRLETHWLGSRRMYGSWEIADIALFILLRRNGGLISRKVALLQNKRLYSKELAGPELELDDFYIGIGRLVDRTEPTFPLTRLRSYGFNGDSRFEQIMKGSPQISRIDQYQNEAKIPVYYGLYCPLRSPASLVYPTINGSTPEPNLLGMRVRSADHVHSVVASLVAGKSPSLSDLAGEEFSEKSSGKIGFRIEDFVADEVLACREGKLFESTTDQNLERLLYERSAPITAAISITIDIGSDA
jgi:hypothetical protein